MEIYKTFKVFIWIWIILGASLLVCGLRGYQSYWDLQFTKTHLNNASNPVKVGEIELTRLKYRLEKMGIPEQGIYAIFSKSPDYELLYAWEDLDYLIALSKEITSMHSGQGIFKPTEDYQEKVNIYERVLSYFKYTRWKAFESYMLVTSGAWIGQFGRTILWSYGFLLHIVVIMGWFITIVSVMPQEYGDSVEFKSRIRSALKFYGAIFLILLFDWVITTIPFGYTG